MIICNEKLAKNTPQRCLYLVDEYLVWWTIKKVVYSSYIGIRMVDHQKSVVYLTSATLFLGIRLMEH